MTKAGKTKKTTVQVVKYLVIALLVCILLFPVWWMLVGSLRPYYTLISLDDVAFWPKDFTVENYVKIFSQAKYLRYFANSFIVSGGTVLVTLLIAIPAAYSFSRFKFGGKSAVLSAVQSVQMFPIVVILISLYTFYKQWGMLDTYRGVILADVTFALPLSITLLKSFFDTVPNALDESAKIDGAGRMRTMVQVILPLVLPGLVAVAIYTFLTAWDDYLMSLTIIRIDEKRTLAVGLAQSFMGEYSNDYGALMAFSVAGSLPIVLLFIFFQKYMVEGLTAGAVKG